MGNCWIQAFKHEDPSYGTPNTRKKNGHPNSSNQTIHPTSSNQTTSSSSSSSSNQNRSGNSSSSVASKNDSTSSPSPSSSSSAASSLKPYTLNELKTATKNFRPDSLLGEGGFGHVYKGWIDETTLAPTRQGLGIVVAIKKLKSESFQGHKEWLAEVNYLGQFHHPNLVKLIGYCLELEQRLLVYEYLNKGSLENHLFRRGVQPLPWSTRINIATGVARGLNFLHEREPVVIFRDLKTSNVLLDSDFNPKLSDFGLARDGPNGDKTHVSTRVVGTRGYAAPEYIATGHLTVKSDVYSYGVVLLELLSGHRAMDDEKYGVGQSLVDWAVPFLNDKRKLLRIMDLKLEGQYSKKGAQTAASLALQCLSNDPKNRPQMREILTSLDQLQTSKA